VTGALLRPSPQTALVLEVRLPDALETLRLRSIADAPDGIPAHVTLLYPFADERQVDDAVVASVEAIVAHHAALTITLGEGRRFPDTLYASVEPDAAIRALQAELAAAFPALPLYGGDFPFEPHVSIVEGAAARATKPFADPAWAELPVSQRVTAVDLITERDGRWASRHRFALRGADAG
jgi:2'-5' RNA ligase